MENESSYKKFCDRYDEIFGTAAVNLSTPDPSKIIFDSEFVKAYQEAKKVPYDEAIKIKPTISVENVTEKTYSELGRHFGYRHGIDAVIADNAKGELKVEHLLDVSFREASRIIEEQNKTLEKTL